MKSKYTTWDGKENVDVKWATVSRTFGAEPSVQRTLENPSDELHSAIFDKDTGAFNDKTAMNMTLADRSSWNHLWDGYNCRTISAMEAYDAIELGYVPGYLRVRASNYMHLV